MADTCNQCLYFIPDTKTDEGPSFVCRRGEAQDPTGNGVKAATCSLYLDARKIRRRLAINLSKYEHLILTNNGTSYMNRQIEKLGKEIEFDLWTLDVENRQVLTRGQLGV